ncbi:MAG: DUF523 and DUF1722 domain-containing protein [Agarilytica sp.]
MKKIDVGISSCLLGQEVRYNGGHKQSKFCVNHLSKVFEFHPFCPEVAVGLGIPREPIRMVGDIEAPRVVGTVDATRDVTEALVSYGKEIAQYAERLSGYVLMKNSPSCGLYSAKIYRNDHPFPGKHAGMFARTLMSECPLLPMEEEGRLNDPRLRENFIARVFAYDDWRASVGAKPTAKKLVDFHSRYKYFVMAHSLAAYKRLGQHVARAGIGDIHQLAAEYIEHLMLSIKKLASRKGHANTMYHLLGYLRQEVPGNIRQALVKGIEDYREGITNLAVPMALLHHYLKMYGSDYVNAQAYLEPYAYDLGLRNTI